MPLTQADKQQIDEYINSNQPHLARAVLEGHLRQEPYDEKARKVLGKLNTRYPAASVPPTFEPIPTPKAKRTATNLTTQPPARAAVSVPAADDMAPIKQAIVEKRFDDAEALLILSDHPDAEKLRERLALIRGSGGGTKMKRDEMPDMTGKLAVTILLLLTLTLFGLVALAIWLPEAKRYPHAPGAGGLLLTNKIVTYILRGFLALLLLLLALLFMSYLIR